MNKIKIREVWSTSPKVTRPALYVNEVDIAEGINSIIDWINDRGWENGYK